MLQAQLTLRDAIEGDMPVICKIYADQVLNGVSSWEEMPPGNEEIKTRYASIVAAGYPIKPS